MKLLLPPRAKRRSIVAKLREFFRTSDYARFLVALEEFGAYYEIPTPDVRLIDKQKDPTNLGLCFEDGVVHIQHPATWKTNKEKEYRSEKMWIRTLLHELCHAIYWAEAEAKAEQFEREFLQ